MFADCHIKKSEHVKKDQSNFLDCDVCDSGSRGLKKNTKGKFKATNMSALTRSVVRKPYE